MKCNRRLWGRRYRSYGQVSEITAAFQHRARSTLVAIYAPGAGGIGLAGAGERSQGELRVLCGYRTSKRGGSGRAGENEARASAARKEELPLQRAAVPGAGSANDAGAGGQCFGAGTDGGECGESSFKRKRLRCWID